MTRLQLWLLLATVAVAATAAVIVLWKLILAAVGGFLVVRLAWWKIRRNEGVVPREHRSRTLLEITAAGVAGYLGGRRGSRGR